MIIQVLHCPYCQETDIVKHGLSSEGKQRDHTLLVCPRAGGTACERSVKRPDAGADDEHGERHTDHEQVILKALSRLAPCPIHKEAVGPMNGDNSHEHLTEKTKGHHPGEQAQGCLLYTSPSPRDRQKSRMPSSA